MTLEVMTTMMIMMIKIVTAATILVVLRMSGKYKALKSERS